MRPNVRWLFALVAVVFAAVGVGLLTPARPLVAQPAKKAPGTDLVPTEGFAVLSVNVAKLHDAEAAKPIRDALEKGDKALLKRLEDDFGMTLEQLSRVTFLWAEPDATMSHSAAVAFVSTRKPFDRARLLKAWRGTVEPKGGGFAGWYGQVGNAGGAVFPGGGVQVLPLQVPGGPPGQPEAKPADAKPKPLDLNAPLYHCGNFGETAIIPIDDTTFVVMPQSAGGPGLVAGLLRKRADGPLADALTLADKHDVVLGVQGKKLRDQIAMRRLGAILGEGVDVPGIPQPPPPVEKPVDLDQAMVEDGFTPYVPFCEFDRAVVTFDFGTTSKLTVTAVYPTAEAAKKAEPVVKTAITKGMDVLAELRKATAADANEKDWLPLIDLGVSGLKAAKVSVDGKTLTATAQADIGAEMKAAFAALPTKIQDAVDRIRLANNLKQLGLALHNYHDANAHLPRDITDGEGKVLLSWRVQLLPYLEQNDLYQKIDQTKAWDDPANKKLWDEMPDVFKVPARGTKEKHETYFQVFRTINWLGKDDPWQVDTHDVTFNDVADGTTQTAAVFEMEEATNWMKPGDPVYDPKKLAKIGNPKTGKAAVLMLDGAVVTLDTKKIAGEKLHAIITANGGEEVNVHDLK